MSTETKTSHYTQGMLERETTALKASIKKDHAMLCKAGAVFTWAGYEIIVSNHGATLYVQGVCNVCRRNGRGEPIAGRMVL